MLNELRVQYARRHQFRTQGISVDGPAITVTRRRRVRRPAHRRQQLGRLRLQPGHLPGDRQPELAARQARASRRASTRSSSPTSASAATCSSTRSRTTTSYLAAKSGAESARLHHPAAAVRQRRRQLQLRLLRLLRPGRLAGHAAAEGALRPALRPLRRAVGAAVRGQPVLAGLHHRQEQLRSARRPVVVARLPRRARSCAPRPA